MARHGRPHRLVSIGRSYTITLLRRLVQEMARVGADQWEVAVAPSFMHGDLGPVRLVRESDEPMRLESVELYLSKHVHVMLYGGRFHAIMKEPWDVVHCWEEPFNFVGGQVAKRAPREALLVFYTFQNLMKRYPPPFNWIERGAMQRAAGWIAAGYAVDETLVKKEHFARRAHRVIPTGVDVNFFRLDPTQRQVTRQRLGWTGTKPLVIGYLGRFVQEKGLTLLMAVLDSLIPPWRALFVGGGPLEDKLRRWSHRYGDRVRIVTGVKHDQVPAYLNAMDVLCAPSQTTVFWREQLGRMLIEAFACGVPVVASDSGEIPYVVKDAGVIVHETDTAGWSQALSVLLEDADRRAELSARGRERAHTVYAWPVVARQNIDFFSELLDGHRNYCS